MLSVCVSYYVMCWVMCQPCVCHACVSRGRCGKLAKMWCTKRLPPTPWWKRSPGGVGFGWIHWSLRRWDEETCQNSLTNLRVNIVVNTSIIELDRRLNLRCSKGARGVFQRCSKAFVSFWVLKVQCILEETLDASGSWCIDPNQYAHLWGLGRRQDRSNAWQLGRNCICQHELDGRISINDT